MISMIPERVLFIVSLFLGPVHTTPFLYKNGEKNLCFCESVHTDPHKNATKTEVFESAFDQCESNKNGCFSLRLCYQADQCERTKTELFLSVFVQNRAV